MRPGQVLGQELPVSLHAAPEGGREDRSRRARYLCAQQAGAQQAAVDVLARERASQVLNKER